MWGQVIVRRDAEESGVLRRGAARRMKKVGTVLISLLLRHWKTALRMLHLTNKVHSVSEDSTDYTEHAMHHRGATPYIIDQT